MHILIGVDRDGTLLPDHGYLGKEDDWHKYATPYAEAPEAIQLLKQVGKVVVATNQTGVAMGYFSLERMHAINEHLRQSLAEEGAGVDGWYSTPYLDPVTAARRGIDNAWVKETKDRKPGIGMLERAAHDFGWELQDCAVYYIGDKRTDMECALNAGGKGVFLMNGENEQEYEKTRLLAKAYPNTIFIVENLLEAAQVITNDVRLS